MIQYINKFFKSPQNQKSSSSFYLSDDIFKTVNATADEYSNNVIVTVTGVSPKPSVYEQYTCQIFERQGGNKRLSYYDSSDVLTIKNINE
jgi:hypothetical protein